MAKANCDLKDQICMGFKNTLVEEEHFLEKNLLEASYDVEIVKVMPCDMELVDLISVVSPTNPILFFIVGSLLPHILFHFFFDPSMAILPKLKTCVKYAPNLD